MQKLLILVALVVSVSLSGCAGQNSIDRTNDKIVEANRGRLESFSTAMSACDEKPGCLVAVSMAFAGNMGQQNLMRPETYLDYIREVRNWIDPIGKIIDRVNGTGGTSGDRAGSYVKGDGNTIIMGNTSAADNGSTAGFTASNTYTKTTTTASDEGTATGPATVILPPEEPEEPEEEPEEPAEVE